MRAPRPARPRPASGPAPLAHATRLHASGSLSSDAFLLLFARPKSSTSPWTACVSPLQRASSSGRGRATATLISLKKFSLWTTSSLASCPSRPGGEREQPRECPLPVLRPPAAGFTVALKSLPKGFEMIKRLAFQLGGFLKLCRAPRKPVGCAHLVSGRLGSHSLERLSCFNASLHCLLGKEAPACLRSRNACRPVRGRAFSLLFPGCWFRKIQRGNESLTFHGCAGISWPRLSCIKFITICKCHAQLLI